MSPDATPVPPARSQCAVLTSAAWNAILTQFADATVYQTWEYGALRWGIGQLRHFTLTQNDTIIAACQLRVIRLSIFGGGIAYVTWGPLWQRRETAPHIDNFQAAVVALTDEFVTRRGMQLRLLPSTRAAAAARQQQAILAAAGLSPTPDVRQYTTYVSDLRQTDEQLRAAMNGNWRRSLKQAEQNAAVSYHAGTALALYDEFLKVYWQMRDFKSFVDFASVDEFRAIHEKLPPALQLRIAVCRVGGEPAAAAVWSELGERGILIFLATNERGREANASYLLVWKMMLSLRAAGCLYYDAGGVDEAANRGVADFKRRLGGTLLEHAGQYDLCRSSWSRTCIGALDWLRRAKRNWQQWRSAAKPVQDTETKS